MLSNDCVGCCRLVPRMGGARGLQPAAQRRRSVRPGLRGAAPRVQPATALPARAALAGRQPPLERP